ncbi:uncharacterized protein LOC129723188 [Wyeomyia smithii]|uniref:uncharacterized protein LOC129723188 n=1 Tax=Wyeomyia smithii TaxID=174621 RepID=UPI002467CF18|nr:uncharacterized protein LOC129723188 [Wyeomyia smithii]
MNRTVILLLGTFAAISLAYGAKVFDILKGPDSGQPNKRIVVHRVGQCVGKKDLPIYLPDFWVTQHNSSHYVLNGVIMVREDFPKGWQPTASVKKCDGFQASASCRPFLDNLASSDVCSMLSASDAMYAKYISSIEPKLRCPFLKGNYTVKQQIYDEVARFLPGSGSTFWEVRNTAKIGDRMIACFIIQLNARPRKVRGSSGQ